MKYIAIAAAICLISSCAKNTDLRTDTLKPDEVVGLRTECKKQFYDLVISAPNRKQSLEGALIGAVIGGAIVYTLTKDRDSLDIDNNWIVGAGISAGSSIGYFSGLKKDKEKLSAFEDNASELAWCRNAQLEEMQELANKRGEISDHEDEGIAQKLFDAIDQDTEILIKYSAEVEGLLNDYIAVVSKHTDDKDYNENDIRIAIQSMKRSIYKIDGIFYSLREMLSRLSDMIDNTGKTSVDEKPTVDGEKIK